MRDGSSIKPLAFSVGALGINHRSDQGPHLNIGVTMQYEAIHLPYFVELMANGYCPGALPSAIISSFAIVLDQLKQW